MDLSFYSSFQRWVTITRLMKPLVYTSEGFRSDMVSLCECLYPSDRSTQNQAFLIR